MDRFPKIIVVGAVLGALLIPCRVLAKVTGACSSCHTMHNSQSGSSVVSGGPLPVLLNNDCKGCHTGVNTGGIGVTPYVLSTNAPIYSTTGTESGTSILAGGNFYWVAMGNYNTGHNVAGITGQDPVLGNTPPGGTSLSSQLTCAGTNGCHGNRAVSDPYASMSGAHHNNYMTVFKDGTTVASSYRFLNTIKGLEDQRYEYQPAAATHHNKYYGKDRTSETDTASGTISSLCAQCHGYFHNGSGKIVASGTSFGAGVWIRHPTDFDMSNALSSTEYGAYNGGSGTNNPYSVIAPLATIDTTTTLNTTVFTSSDDAIVMCISCHRAHGTPYASILRWNYRDWPGASGYNGCGICHSTKN